MILIYTGTGKGKTCACIGQIMRGLGCGLTVAMGQFLKKDNCAGEQTLLKQLLGENFKACGSDFFHSEADRPLQTQKATELLAWAFNRNVQMLALDEALYALHFRLINDKDLLPLLEKAKEPDRHLILTGRYMQDWLLRQADIVTSMESLKHHFDLGTSATPGIEY